MAVLWECGFDMTCSRDHRGRTCREGSFLQVSVDTINEETTEYSDTFDLVGALREQANHPSWGRLAE